MSKQIVKRFTMLMLVAGLAFGTAVVSANGQNTPRVVADVPFEFIVGNKTLPSGNYTVSRMTQAGEGLLIRSRDGKASAIRLANTVTGNSKESKARLVFHRYGQIYFLAEVWNGDQDGRELRRSSKERTLQREQTNIAKSNSPSGGYEIVEVVAALR